MIIKIDHVKKIAYKTIRNGGLQPKLVHFSKKQKEVSRTEKVLKHSKNLKRDMHK